MDLKCTKELHELHNDYPLASDKIKIKMFSHYQLIPIDISINKYN